MSWLQLEKAEFPIVKFVTFLGVVIDVMEELLKAFESMSRVSKLSFEEIFKLVSCVQLKKAPVLIVKFVAFLGMAIDVMEELLKAFELMKTVFNFSLEDKSKLLKLLQE